jgi:hypothetical protein
MASFDVYPEVEALPKPEIEPLLLPQSASPSNASDVSNVLALPPLAIYPSRKALFEAIQSWSKSQGYAFTVQKSRKLPSGCQRVQYACDRCPPVPPPSSQCTRNTRTRGTGCLFSILAIELSNSLGWEVRYRPEAKYNTHNHPPSQSPAVHPSHRHLSIQAKATSQNLFSVGK